MIIILTTNHINKVNNKKQEVQYNVYLISLLFIITNSNITITTIPMKKIIIIIIGQRPVISEVRAHGAWWLEIIGVFD